MMRCGFQKNNSVDDSRRSFGGFVSLCFSGAWCELLIDPLFEPAVILAPVRCLAPDCDFMFMFFGHTSR